MRILPLPSVSRPLFFFLVLAAFFGSATTAGAVTNHIVISELATRGPSSATDEFVELYNPTDSPIDISGWKLQYNPASASGWLDRATLPANSIVAARGYFLITNQGYSGSVTADYSSGSWGTGAGMADNGHARVINGAAAEVDKVGWGTAISPEGNAAQNHGTTANNNSIERKASATSTADSLAAGGAHSLLGNGQDTSNNNVDFAVQTHGRNPQNSSSPAEPSFASGGNGTGRARVTPTVVYASHALDSLKFSFGQDSSYTITDIAIPVPASWTWSHLTSSVVLAGDAFEGASTSIVDDTIFVSAASLSPTDSGTVTIADLTTPPTKGNSSFAIRTAIASGTLTLTAVPPLVRVLELVPIVVVHVNDATGVPVSPYNVGNEATVTGIVTANMSTSFFDVYVQDGTSGIDLFSGSFGPITLAPGDSITVTGSILQFRGLTEISPDFNLLVRHATGRPVPEPAVFTCAQVNATFQPDYTEPDEGRLIRINGVSYNSVNSTITDASGTTAIFIPGSFPPTPSVFDVIGILKQFKPGTPAPGPPYTADYEIVPRTPADIIAHPGPILLTAPTEDQIQPTSVRVNWTTNVASSSIVRFGTTPALGDSFVDPSLVTTHAATVPGLTPATIYYYSAGSGDVNGTNFSTTDVFCTASPPQTTGEVNAYFNKSANTNLAWLTPANANQDLVARLVTRLDNAKRSIDATLYSLSGTPGSTLATALINAKNRGVKVRVICEYDNKSTSAFTSISSAGIPMIDDRFDPVNFGLGLMHNKFFIVDGRNGAPDSAWVWTGSWNPTDPGTNNDFQNAIELQDQSLAHVYTLEFNEMWGSDNDTPNASASRFGPRKLDNTPHKFSIGGIDVESYFSPSDNATGQIVSLIEGAEHSVAFALLTITEDDIGAALVAQHVAGTDVRGVMDNGSDSGSEYNNLLSSGVDVWLKTGAPGLLHHKYLLVDAESPGYEAATLTGSHNWSASAENNNGENTLIVRDFDITNQYLQEFAARYYQFGGTDSVVVGVEPGDGALALSLAQNFPNPFRDRTLISYAIPRAEQVTLRLYDVQGREVRSLVDQWQPAGRYRVELGTKSLGSGVYFYRLQVGKAIQQRKMLLLK